MKPSHRYSTVKSRMPVPRSSGVLPEDGDRQELCEDALNRKNVGRAAQLSGSGLTGAKIYPHDEAQQWSPSVRLQLPRDKYSEGEYSKRWSVQKENEPSSSCQPEAAITPAWRRRTIINDEAHRTVGMAYGGTVLMPSDATTPFQTLSDPIATKDIVDPRPTFVSSLDLQVVHIAHGAKETATPANGGGSKGPRVNPQGPFHVTGSSGDLGVSSQRKTVGSRLREASSEKLQNNSKLVNSPSTPSIQTARVRVEISNDLKTLTTCPLDIFLLFPNTLNVPVKFICFELRSYAVGKEKSDGPTNRCELRVQSGFLDHQMEGHCRGKLFGQDILALKELRLHGSFDCGRKPGDIEAEEGRSGADHHGGRTVPAPAASKSEAPVTLPRSPFRISQNNED
ncbi:hypothetical protein EDB83DRAFT_2551554 [Lactarius deliciosus]|nr:hypothetical protein EDB83DRAFT_2551554 [Lactarius deliciosus]